MAIVTGDRYIEKLVKFVDERAGALIEGTKVLKLNPAGLHYVQSRLEALQELERLLAGTPVDYLRAYVSDLGDHRALEQLRRILRLLTTLKVVSALSPPARDPTPLFLLPFVRLKVLELRGCDLSTSAAKGLLELRHTLEKIICHNSTDALRHVFASRIAEIKSSPQWNRLSFVSCACNGLLLMDESLQLLPAVETLDLSRNKFAKVDNLRKCAKLKHLDLGFNHLRSISSFSEVSRLVVKLVLRNNALTTLRGIENLKSLEGLDVSYNIISNFLELEFLEGLPSLRSLWLEGNPLCCARWYRAHVFSYFSRPENLKLDDKEISTKEHWKRMIIVASRQKRPSSFGFYYPAKYDAEGEGVKNKKRIKASRLACIENEQENTHNYSDLDSVSCHNEMRSGEENIVSEDEAEIVDLMKRVEQLKKERSILWLRLFKDWMDHPSENFADGDSAQASGDESSMNVLESDNSFADMSSSVNANRYFDHIFSSGITGGLSLPGLRTMDVKQEYQNSYLHDETGSGSILAESSHRYIFALEETNRMVENASVSHLNTIDNITESNSSSANPGSPPHYKDLLHRRQNLVEEILQLSAESYSEASSDSDTSCSEDDYGEAGIPAEEYLNRSTKAHSPANFFECAYYENGNNTSHGSENGICIMDSCAEQAPRTNKFVNMKQSLQLYSELDTCSNDLETSFVNQEADWFENRNSGRKPKRRVISLLEENSCQQVPRESNGGPGASGSHIKEMKGKLSSNESDHHKDFDRNQTKNAIPMLPLDDGVRYSQAEFSSQGKNDFIEDYFNKNVADLRVHETCREVALVLSSKEKLYVLLVGGTFDGSESTLDLLGSHRVEDIRAVLVGLSLQVARVNVERSVTYLFITRSFKKSIQLLYTLKLSDLSASIHKCSLRSLEQVQVELFEKQICGGLKLSISQYSMVLFQKGGTEEESWLSRSLFVIGGQVIVCVEDIIQFSSILNDACSPPYFSLDSCCNIADVSEMVIDNRGRHCVTLSLECSTSKACTSKKMQKENNVARSRTWKMMWFSEECLFQFVALVKAIHLGLTSSPLHVRFES
ncbi:Binding protein, putative isoform 2 [Hibiscus syriacus]|uniref:Binding protein, putative isoform 2 n=1 Tax=Hibiscus syriacus TaxID=106335 RepID=A0A6A2Y2K4_HIBSY|nr:Binding protein, putative isoform 2 [Hibiscus syriacus]